jgi:hypothetical protein
MPDGTIIKNVPEGTTKAQLNAKLAKNGFNLAELTTPKQKPSAIENIPLVGGLIAPVADIPLSAVEGLSGTVKSISDVFGADNAVSDAADYVSQAAAALKSAGSREDLEIARKIQKDAEGKGVWEEVKAAARAFTYSPLESTASVAGSAIPFIGAGYVGGGAGLVGLGAASGVGTAKGAIYDAVYDEFVKGGASKKDAEAAAEQAQEYGGKNTDQIALAGTIGAVAAATGFAPQISRTIGANAAKNVAAKVAAREAIAAKLPAGSAIEVGARRNVLGGAAKSAVIEAVPEAVQGGQEQLAQNLALQREGFDVDTWKGVAGQAASEGIASLFLGGYGGAREARAENREVLTKEIAQEFEALPPEATEEAVSGAVERFTRRGFPLEKAQQVVDTMVKQKAAIEKQAAELEQARAERMAQADVEATAEEGTGPNFTGPPPVDTEEEAVMQRMREAEATGVEPLDIEEDIQAPPAGAPYQRGVKQPTIVTPARAATILNNPDTAGNYNTVSDFAATTGMDTREAESVLDDIANEVPDAPIIKYSRGRPPSASTVEAAGQENLFGALPTQEENRLDKFEEIQQRKLEQGALAPEQREAERQAQADEFDRLQQERAAKDEEYKAQFVKNIEDAIRRANPANEAYSVQVDETSPKPYRIVGPDGELFAAADNLKDFEEQAMDLMPYVAPAAPIQETDSTKPTVATSMVQEITAEIDAARERGEIDNNQRTELIRQLERPDAYDKYGRPQDNIAKAETEALEAMSKFRNATGVEAKAAEAELAVANEKLAKLVNNRMLNPIRSRLRSMSEMRKDEQLGAKIRIKDALKVLAKRMVIVVHGGSDFDALDPKKLGTGEPGNLRPLGNGFYGFVVDKTNPEEVAFAVDYARVYSEKYGRGTKAIHAFQLDMSDIETRFNGPIRPSLKGPKTTAKAEMDAAWKEFGDAPLGSDGWRKFKEARKKYEDSVGLTVERLPIGLTEVAVNELGRLERIGKVGLNDGDDKLVSAIQDALLEGKQQEVAARKELREAKIDLAESRVSKYRRGEAQPGQVKTDVAKVRAAVDAIVSVWKGPPVVEVVQSVNDIADAKIRRAVMQDNATNAEGFVAPDGTVYLIADNLESVERAKAVLFHEALGHVGLERLFRDELDGVLGALYKSNGNVRAKTDAWLAANPEAYPKDKDQIARAVEEVLAEMSETGQLRPTMLKRIAAIIRNYARKLGINLAISDADVEAILAAGHERVVSGAQESTLVKGMRYISGWRTGGDRIRPAPDAAKTFLRELGVYTGRELNSMSSEEAVNAASRAGIDEEWVDYFNSQQRAAWAPEGSNPIKLPQPNMSKYMPKYSRPKTTKKDKEALEETSASMSDGLRRTQKSTSTNGIADGIGEAVQGRKFSAFLNAFKDNSDGMGPPTLKAILKTIPTSGILNWFGPDIPSIREIDTLVQKMVAMKANIIKAAEDIGRELDEFLLTDKKQVLASLQSTARINEYSPDEFKSADEALANHPAMKEIEARILKNSNDKALAARIIAEMKALTMQGKEVVPDKGDKVKMSDGMSKLMAGLSKTAIDRQKTSDQTKQVAELTRRIRDVHKLWDELGKLKNGHKLYLEMRAYYKDMFEAELALLDGRISTIAGEVEAKRLRDLRADMMREVMNPDEAKKSGDIFHDLDSSLFTKDYFPFMREGQYYVRVSAAKDGSREREFYQFYSAKDMQAAQKAIAKRLGVDPEKNEGVITVGYDIAQLQENLKSDDQMMQKIFDLVSKAKAEFAGTKGIDANSFKDLTDSIYQTWLLSTPERSVRRRFMHAQEVVGFQQDLLQQFASQASNYANQLSKLAYAGDIRLKTEEARDNVSDRDATLKAKYNSVIDELEERAEDEINPSPQSAMINLLNRASYFYYLTAPATAMLQLTSIPIRVVPRLWRDYGYAEGTRMWLKYMKIWNTLGKAKVQTTRTGLAGVGDELDVLMPNINSSKLINANTDEGKLLRRALAAGMERNVLETVQDTLIQNERETAKRHRTGATRTAVETAALTGKAMGVMFQGLENISRQAAYFMAFELAYKAEAAKNTDTSAEAEKVVFNKAVTTALDTVRDTLGDYSNWERSSIMKNNLSRALFLFKMHPILQTKFLVGAMRDISRGLYPGASPEAKAARAGAMKELGGVLMMSGVFGGLLGMPLYSVMALALAESFDEEDDEDVRKLMGLNPRIAYDSDIMFRSWLMDKFGEPAIGDVSMADILIHGPVGALSNTEISSRTSLDLKNMWFREAVAGDSTGMTVFKTLLANVAGGQMVIQGINAYDNFAEGDMYGGIKKLAPAFVRSWVAAGQGEAEGIVNRKGDAIVEKEDITLLDTFRTISGFRPMRLARWQDVLVTAAKNDKKIKAEKTQLLSTLDRKIREGEITSKAQLQEFITDEIIPFNRTYPDPNFIITEETIMRSIKGRAEVRSRTVQGMRLEKKTAKKDFGAVEKFRP